MVRCLLRGALTLFSCITCLLSSAFVLADKETEQTIAHALITKDDFLPLSPSVFFFLSWLFFLPSPETFSVNERKLKLNIRNARQPSKDLSFVLCTNHGESYRDRSLFIYFACFFFMLAVLVSLSLLGRQRERETDSQRRERKKKENPQSIMSVGE